MPIKNYWTASEDDMLRLYVSRGKSVPYISKKIGRTENAVRLRMKRIDLASFAKRRKWTIDEESAFAIDWVNCELSNKRLMTKYNRTWKALQMKAVKLQLGPRVYDTSYLTVKDVSDEMSISDDRVYHWIELGLKTHKSLDNRQKYLINADELLKFLEQHQNLFSAHVVSDTLFYKEPTWFKNKRKDDSKSYLKNAKAEWTNEQDKTLLYLYKSQNWSIERIAEHFGRTPSAVKTHLYVLCVQFDRRDVYSEEELKYLKDNSDNKTIAELSEILGRTQDGLMYKCKMMNLPYHISKNRVRLS